MPGMTGPHAAALAAGFRAALLAQGTALFAVFVVLAISWVACREVLLARARGWLVARRAERPAEPAWRRVLRIGFGVLWIADGLLQAQPAMPGGLAASVLAPAAAGSPGWVADLTGWGARVWAGDPLAAAAGAVWIQLGIGIWLLSAASPRWSRLAGLASAAWGLIVWTVAEALGGIFAPGASWLGGAPGSAFFYAVAGLLLALPARHWRDPRLGRRLPAGTGVLLAAAALAQAWPGRGSWSGAATAAMSRQMAAVPQPGWPRSLVSWFAAVTAAHGFAVNLTVVILLAAGAAGLVSGRSRLTRPAGAVMIGLCLAVWVLIQDIGVFGGLGTDPNSMPALAVILAAGLAAGSGEVEAETARPASPAAPSPRSATPPLRRAWRAARSAGRAFGAAGAGAVLAVWAVVMVAAGVAPMLAAAIRPA